MTPKEYSMLNVAPTISAILNVPVPAQSAGAPIAEIVHDLSGAARLALIAPDALGLFAWNLWKAEMPYLSSLHEQCSLVLRSVLPSITPVNFGAMVTGAGLEIHGSQTFKHNFTCETLFDTIRKAGGNSAGVGLDGYTGSALLGRFADIWGNAGAGDDADVERTVLEIAVRERPTFIISQLGVVDDVFHRYGPSSPLVVPMLQDLDARLKRMVGQLKALGYVILILSDHGQHDVNEPELKGTHGTDSDIDCLVPCTWVS
jgi:predicted AlkP superfamily pyrophosphatase or phosphodiesterase